MDINLIFELFSTLGIPTAFAVAMLILHTNSEKRYHEEISKLNATINNNTIAITTLAERIGSRKDG